MRISDVLQVFKSREYRLAWLVALAADGIQILVLPFFVFGAFSPADPVIDLVAAVLLSRLLGWHWAFLPTLLTELLPGFDLFPTWTAAVSYVTVQRARAQSPDIEVEHVPTRRLLNS